MTTATAGSSYLRPIAEVKILGCDGTKTIANNGIELFTAPIDSDFRTYAPKEHAPATPEVCGQVSELVRPANFLIMFGNLDHGLGKLALTEHQILEFVHNHADLLPPEGSGMFILCKNGDTFCVVCVSYRIGGLNVRRCDFGFGIAWPAVDGYRTLVCK